MKRWVRTLSTKIKTSILVATLLTAQVAGAAAPFMPSTVHADGNNGTLKVHEIGTPSGTENNDPKVCAFNFEGFGFDPGQEGRLQIDVQGNDAPHGAAAGPFVFGPTDGSGYAISQDFNAGAGTQTILNGHYKVTLYGKDKDGQYTEEKAKSKDFKVTCGVTPVVPDLATSVSNSAVALGDSVTDTASFTPIQANGDVTGTVDFFVCGPDQANPDCTNGGTQVGSSVAVSSNQAVSTAFTPTQAGHYCFRANYTPDGGANYLATSHTNQTTECFTASKTIKACVGSTGTTEVTAQNLQGFDFSETRSTGHYDFTVNGLHIYTEGATSTDKVAAYKAVDVPLTDVGDTTMDYTSNSGIAPGYQLVVDFDNNGTPDGILVGEPSFYGNDWWLSNSAEQFVKDGAPHNSGGSGSQWHGTLNEWLQAFPDAQVKAFGFSLGSGVHADGVLHSINFGCHTYVFTAPRTGTLKVVKTVVNDNGGTKTYADFHFSVNGGSNQNFDHTIGNNGAKELTVPVGQYTVTEPEANQNGYATSYAGCSDVSVTAGQTTTCYITNNDIAPTLRLVKNVVGGGSPHDWVLTANTNHPPTLSGRGDSFGVQTAYAGVGYHLSESGPNGYTAGPWICTDDQQHAVPVGPASNKIVLAVGQNVTCTITNTRDTGTVKVIKLLKPANDNGRFDLSINGPTTYTAYNVGNFGTTGSQTVGTGTYTVSETAHGGTSMSNYASSYVCWDGFTVVATGNGTTSTSFSVAKGHNVVCVFTNTHYGSISGTKYEVNANGQHVGVIGGVQICIDSNHNHTCDQNETSTTTNGSGHFSFSNFLAGTYSLIEKVGNGWTQLFGDGNVTLSDGQNATHDFGNFKNASISGYKWNDLNGNGTKNYNEPKLSHWQIKLYKGFQALASTTTDHWGNYEFNNLVPGTYTVCEVQQYGWQQTYPDPHAIDTNNFFGCHIVYVTQSGHNYSNTNFGNQGRGTITVIKNVDDGFGHVTRNVTNWKWDVDGGTSNSTGSHNSVGVPAGWHIVSEHQKDGYHVTASSCHGSEWDGEDEDSDHHDFNISQDNMWRPSTSQFVKVDPGDHIVCTFTNTRNTGTVTVIKNVDDGLGNVTHDVTNWTWNIDEGSDHATGSKNAVKVTSGRHTVSENQKDGYHVTASSCHGSEWDGEDGGEDGYRIGSLVVQRANTSVDVYLHSNEHIICTFTNTRDTGSVTVNKVLFPTNDPGKFNLQIDGITAAANVGNGGTTGSVKLATGMHSVSETAGTGVNMSDYNASYSCTNGLQGTGTSTPMFMVAKDTNVSCTFTNQHKVVPQVLGDSTGGRGAELTNTGLPIVAFTLAALTLLSTALFVGTTRRTQ